MSEDLYLFVQLKQKSFEKYVKARADIDKPGRHWISNRILEDDDFFEFTAAELCAWLYIMNQASLQQRPNVRLILDKIDALKRKFSREDLNNAISKLKELGVLLDVTSTLRGRNVDVPLERRGEEGIGERENSSAADSNSGELGINPTLSGNSKREKVLATVPMALQADWLAKYDPTWLKNSLTKAIEYYAKGRSPQDISDWRDKFIHWLDIEKKPKFRAKPRPDRVKDPPAPWPTGKGHVISDPRLQETLAKVLKTV